MLRLLSVFTLFILFASANAQHVAISPSSMNVLYVGIDNPIAIAAEGLLNKDLIVRISDAGTITPVADKPGHYNASVSKVGSTNISVYQKLKNGNEKLLSEQKFRVKQLPEPVVYIGNYKGGIIEHNNLKAQSGLYARLEGFDFDAKFAISSFTLSTCRDGIIYTVENYGSYFYTDARKLINSAHSGDVLVFDNIRVIYPGGTVRKIGALVVYVDGLLNRTCADGRMKLPMYPVYSAADSAVEDLEDYSRITLNCSCDCIDEAKGNYKDGRKDGWWEYNKITDKEIETVRKEFYNKDTVKQEFYEEGVLVKRVTLIGKKAFGTYDEYYPNGTQKIHGQYTLDTVAADTVMQINPVTLEESLFVEYRTDSFRIGEWFFYDSKGMLIRKEVYEPGINRWVIDK